MTGISLAMDRDSAEAWASVQWCQRNGREPVSRVLLDVLQIGYTDGEFNYFLGSGKTWTEAVMNAAEKGNP